MTTQYTPILKLALPVQGELDGTWGDVVNNNITSMVEQAVAGAATINTWTANVHTLTTANGTTSESRCAMLIAQTGAGGTALTAAGQIICPAATKLYVLRNESAYAVTLKTAAGSGISVLAGATLLLLCDGTNVWSTGVAITDVSGLAAGIATFLITPTSANLRAAVTDETGTGALVFANSPALTSPTFSGGTANGVLYLNGSLVATSGSGLTFDGTNLGVGVTPSAWSDIKAIEFAGSSFFGANSIGTGAWYGQNCYYDGTNWRAKVTGESAYSAISAGVYSWNSAPSVAAGAITAPVERMRLDASGNLGLGVTPSPWGSNFKALDIGGNVGIAGFANSMYQLANAYAENAAYRYKASTFASAYLQTTGQHQWFTAPSGTAGNTITFTQAMTLNASGNLSVAGTATVAGAAVTTASNTQTLTNKTLNSAVLNDGYTEEVFAITDGATVNLDPNNGSIQTWTLGASRTPGQVNWASGQSITLQIDDGTAFTITWSTLAVVWKTDGGAAPVLNATGITVIVLWKVGTTIYGARVGDA